VTAQAVPHERAAVRRPLLFPKVRRSLRLTGWGMLVSVVAAWALFLRPQALGGTASYVIVSGHSMEPTLGTGDFVLALPQRSYERGDVIVYPIEEGQAGAGTLVIHRIVGGSPTEGYMTQGDDRRHRDPWRPKPTDIAGKLKLHVPHLGVVSQLAHTSVGMAFIASVVGFIVLLGGNRRK
jgi:signal peptidase I